VDLLDVLRKYLEDVDVTMKNSALIGTPEQWTALSERDKDRLQYFHDPASHPRWKRVLVTTLLGGDDFDFPAWVAEKVRQEILEFPTRTSPRVPIPNERRDTSHRRENNVDNEIDDGVVKATTTEPKTKIEAAAFRMRNPWPDDIWGVPNALVRTALFTSAKGNAGVYPSVPLASPTTTTLFATGTRLTQGDLEVFLNILHRNREGRVLQATPRQFLRDMQRGAGTREIDSLKSSLRRLIECRIEISVWNAGARNRTSWEGNLIRFPDQQQGEKLNFENGHPLRITLDPALGDFIGEDVTWIPIKDRAALRKHRLASGLFAVYSTHVNPEPLHIKDVSKLLGLSVSNSDYEERLRLALRLLEQKKLILGWRIDSALLHVTPQLTPTKIRYLKKRGTEPVIVKTANHPRVVCRAEFRSKRWSWIPIRFSHTLSKCFGQLRHWMLRATSDPQLTK
jgi:hypothetical protein